MNGKINIGFLIMSDTTAIYTTFSADALCDEMQVKASV